jgi:hypothetical protein
MVIVNFKTGLLSLSSYGKIGDSWGLGEMICGDTLIGNENKIFGVYQRRKGLKGTIIVKMIYRVPPDPKTSKQLASRFFFTRMIKSYYSLSQENKDLLESLAKPLHLSGKNIYCILYQKQKPSFCGSLDLGYSQIGDLTELL